MTRSLLAACASVLLLSAHSVAAPGDVLPSPNGKLEISFSLENLDGRPGCPVYHVTWQGRRILDDSRLGFELAERPLRSGLTLVEKKERRHDGTWQTVCGERREVRDNGADSRSTHVNSR